jgi:hypothetical protein
MRRAIFLLPFSVVTVAVLSVFASWLPIVARASAGDWLQTLSRFSDPLPGIFNLFMPNIFRLLAFLLLAVLVFRRLYLLAVSRTLKIPAEYGRIPYALLWVAAVSIAIGSIALVVASLFEPSQGIVAIRILNPAMLLAPLAVTWGEIKTIGSTRHAS